MNSVRPFTHRFSPCVCTVGNKPASVPTVGSADTASRNNVRLHLVSCRLQVSAHLFEDQPFRPINDSVNVLANDPARSNSPNNVEHCGPQVAIILCSSPLSCEAERLARLREPSGKDNVLNPPVSTSIRSFQMVKSAVRMSSYCFALGKWYLSMVRQKGSISQLKAFVQPAHSAARSNPPIPLNSDAWVIRDHRLSPFESITPRSRRLASLSRFCCMTSSSVKPKQSAMPAINHAQSPTSFISSDL